MYQLTDRQMSSQINDEVVILDHADGIYFGLENVGATIWNKLQEGPQEFEILVAAVCDTFEVDANSCQSDIYQFLDELIKQKLVTMS